MLSLLSDQGKQHSTLEKEVSCMFKRMKYLKAGSESFKATQMLLSMWSAEHLDAASYAQTSRI